MKRTKITSNLFDLSQEEIGQSKNMYNGKIIKCLVAPYHDFKTIEEELIFRSSTFLFPEREVSNDMIKRFVSLIVSNNDIKDEVHIITTDMSIICDMIDSSVRILTENGDIINSPEKTFMANIHTIRYKLLENNEHRISNGKDIIGKDILGNIIDKLSTHIDNNETINKNTYDSYKTVIDTVGESVLRNSLTETLNTIQVV